VGLNKDESSSEKAAVPVVAPPSKPAAPKSPSASELEAQRLASLSEEEKTDEYYKQQQEKTLKA